MTKGYTLTADGKYGPTRTYNSYRAMKERCRNPNSHRYPRYGGRGIKICEHWLKSFKNFVTDMGERPDGHTLDRINNDGDYEPGNCEWSDIFSQNRGKSDTVLNIKLAYRIRKAYETGARVCDISREYGLNRETCRLAAIGKTWYSEPEEGGKCYVKNCNGEYDIYEEPYPQTESTLICAECGDDVREH